METFVSWNIDYQLNTVFIYFILIMGRTQGEKKDTVNNLKETIILQYDIPQQIEHEQKRFVWQNLTAKQS